MVVIFTFIIVNDLRNRFSCKRFTRADQVRRPLEVLAQLTLAADGAVHRPLEALTVLLQALALLAVASRSVPVSV